jgi:hypothetical protein
MLINIILLPCYGENKKMKFWLASMKTLILKILPVTLFKQLVCGIHESVNCSVSRRLF